MAKVPNFPLCSRCSTREALYHTYCYECHNDLALLDDDAYKAPSTKSKSGWRKITEKDIKLGTVVAFRSMINDGSFGMAVIINIMDNNVTFSRPMVYAGTINNRTGYLYEEVFTSFKSSLLKQTDVEVFEDSKGNLRTCQLSVAG